MQYLEFNAGKDPLEDRYVTGLLAGVNEILNMTIEDIAQEDVQQDD